MTAGAPGSSASAVERLSPADLVDLATDPEAAERPVTDGSSPLTVVDLSKGTPAALAAFSPGRLRWRVVVGYARSPERPPPAVLDVALCAGPAAPGWVEVADVDAALGPLRDNCAAAPLAAGTLAQVLALNEQLPLPDGLVVESMAYSMLQAGPEFAAWLAAQPPRAHRRSPEPVLVERVGATLVVTLNRPEVRNAYDSHTRDALVDVLRPLAALDDPPPVVLDGAGPVFSSGGDLGEFGESTDPVRAHAIRTARSPGLLLRRIGATARVHGPCVGAGIEVPAFCPMVEATPGATFRLPELSMGLIPGAGGTASILARIGRSRTAYLAFSGQAVPAATALDWGLVDRIVPGR
ncbi:MAG TPA: enoyl-CoA hydratase/isomerase family protein [Acidimicrobiales bacterium]|nr:enoyl-CoA hydratase/isomerase family protein [Acidimicrobiales bacterium]